MIRASFLSDLAIGAGLTLLGAGLAWLLALGVPLIGIDDAAITRSYADNLARGVGYVYNIGGERVEGSTAILWVGILTVAYSLTPTPEAFIVALCAGFVVLTVTFVIRLTRLICVQLGCDARPALWTLAVFLLASPGFFMWSVWTMMEVALWSLLLMWLVYLLASLVEGVRSSPAMVSGICCAALLLPLVRPEGIMVALGLIALAGLLAPRRWRVAAGATFCALIVFAVVTMFRVSYFGQPFPNTFYAKVSSDRIQDLEDGLKYFFDFVLSRPFTELFVVVWLGVSVWALLGLRHDQPGRRSLLIAAAAIFGILMVYAVLGGDHFVLWRFFQPITPLLPVALAVLVAGVVPLITGSDRAGVGPTRRPLLIAGSATLLAVMPIGWLHYYQERFDVQSEFQLVERGLGFGTFLNGFSPQPVIGVGPAGGIALAYDGEILDLLGLNWTEMAHANPVKVGMRNHASFDLDTFWRHAPDVVTAFNRPCMSGPELIAWAEEAEAFDGLLSKERFRRSYHPVIFRSDQDCWPGFASVDWINTVGSDTLVQSFNWPDMESANGIAPE